MTAASNNDNLKPGIILANMGIRYKNYCSNMGRTFLISPSKKQESQYTTLLEVRKEALALLKTGAVASDVYTSVHRSLETKNGTLADSFLKNLGFAVSEFRGI